MGDCCHLVVALLTAGAGTSWVNGKLSPLKGHGKHRRMHLSPHCVALLRNQDANNSEGCIGVGIGLLASWESLLFLGSALVM